MKPFRLMNTTESAYLQTLLSNRLQRWNEDYAIYPLSCVINHKPEQPDDLTSYHDFGSEGNAIWLSPLKARAFIQDNVFGHVANSFDEVSHTLYLTLLNQLGETTGIAQQGTPNLNEWFYKGSPCISVTLSSITNALTLYLHPQWVLKTLPQQPPILTQMTPLNEALNEQALRLDVTLNPFTLPLTQITHLNIGDVIKTDHPVSMPLKLIQDNTTLCQVDIGDETIQITRTL